MNQQKLILTARIVIAVTAVAFILIGLLGGAYSDALRKAVLVCLECIGIG